MPTRLFLCTRLRYFLTEIPLILLLCVTIQNHSSSTELLQFYPLEIVTVCAIIATFLYFFRTATLTPLTVRKFGAFSERETHDLSVGETIVLLLDERGYLHITVEGEDDAPGLSWCKSDRRHRVLFRTRVILARQSAHAVLSLYGLSASDASAALGTQDYTTSNESIHLSAQTIEHGRRLTLTLLSLPKVEKGASSL